MRVLRRGSLGHRPQALLVYGILCCATQAAASGPSPTRPRYVLHAAIRLTAPHIDGTIDVSFTNNAARTLDDVVFVLFANRFSVPDEGINDFNRPFVYPEEDFVPGYTQVMEARDAGAPTTVEPIRQPGVPDGCFVRLHIAPLPPGDSRTLSLRFRTVAPYRFGSFGVFEDQLTLNGGWYPYLATLSADGTWEMDEPPALADFDVHLSVDPAPELLLNGAHFSGQPVVDATVPAVHYVSLVVARHLLRDEVALKHTRIVLYRRPPRRTSRISPEPEPSQILLATLRDIVRRRPAGLPEVPAELVVVEAPLRLNLTAPGEGMVVVSDRALKVLWLLRPFHELQLAQGVYAELLRPTLARREPAADYVWVSEGLSRILANRFVAQTRPGTRSVQDWIELFNIFAIVDRFESAPKIPFVDAFFERARLADPLHTEIGTFNSALPPGRVVLGKLREVAGPDRFDAIMDRCVPAVMPFRRCAATVAEQNLDWLFLEWLQPYPALNYRFAALELNERGKGFEGTQANGTTFHHRLTIVRDSSRPVTEPVQVRLRSLGGRDVDVRWDGSGQVAELSVNTPRRVCQAVIDPERKLIEDRRDDNFRPPEPQIVLDTAEVEISSTEFGFSGLVVGRARYDYRKDLALAAFYTNRSLGMDAGVRGHWGTPIDATSYRHNLYAFYGVQSLDGAFIDKRDPQVRTPGTLASLGVRYDYTDIFAFDHPTNAHAVRLYADWYDGSLGSNFNYVDWGASLTLTHPLWSYRRILAGQILNGFSEPLGNSVVANQGLYSLGGSRSIRGIGAEEELGRNLLLVRGELRQDIYPELDLNFLDLLVLRRAQVRLFVDSGRVGNSAGRLYDVSGFAVGVGTGFAAVYDFMGFFPSLAYVEIATRADRSSQLGDVQVLFGTRQAF
jgi:hypothetical protein